jgi:hypothetical protein
MTFVPTSPDLFNSAIKRLKTFGIVVTEADYETLDYCVSLAEQQLKNFLNVGRIPSALKLALVDMICGEFLFLKKSLGELDIFGNEEDIKNPLVRQIAEGKTTVVFATEQHASASNKLDMFIQNLRQGGFYGGSTLYNFRRMPRCNR